MAFVMSDEEVAAWKARRPYEVVDLFEQVLCEYTGAPYAIATNSCTNSLLLALMWERMHWPDDDELASAIRLPRRTYIGVLQSVLNAGWEVEWDDRLSTERWQNYGHYRLEPTMVWDGARFLRPRMYLAGFACLSFHAAKQLPLGRGGAILTDNEEAAEYFRAARMDGRAPGDNKPPLIGNTAHCPMAPDVAARGLDIMSRWNDTGYTPPLLLPTDYPDLSQWYPR